MPSLAPSWPSATVTPGPLPLLGIMGLRARDIIGYTAILCVAMGLVVPLLLWIAY